MPLGPIFVSVEGKTLTPGDQKILSHNLVGGVVLFSRNYENKDQLKLLIKSIKSLKSPDLLVAVDQEGGRVQRFISGFYPIPSMRSLGNLYDQSCENGMQATCIAAEILGLELLEVGVDFSFAPVLDIDHGVSEVIGSRSFHSDPKVVDCLGEQFYEGLQKAGMNCVAKHFPGHGGVREDSHQKTPVDNREMKAIIEDLQPYKTLIKRGLSGIMTAHVRYPLVDDQIATFSHYWLRKCLQKELHFNGIIFSDDLMMKSTDFITSTPKKALLSFAAGCDFVLICNSQETVNQCLSELDYAKDKFANLERKIQYLIPFHQGQRQAKYLQEIKTKLNRLLDSLK